LESPIDILKIDCEGAEYPILYNTSPQVLSKVVTMVIEVHDLDQNDRNAGSLEKYLQVNGFETVTQKFNNNCHLMTAKNQKHNG
jgi:hypothetical protein